MGLENTVGSCFGFMRIDRELLFDDLIESVLAEDVVFELPEEIEPERDVLFRVRDLRDKGYSFALSGYRGNSYYLEPLLDQMALVQVSMSEASDAFLQALGNEVRRPGVRLMARQVETIADYDRARASGFDLFQGYHFLKPEPVLRARPSAAALLKMLKLLRDDADSPAIVDELKRQPALSVATLRAVNASSNALMRRTIASLSDAVAMLGRDRLTRLVQMLIFVGDSNLDIGHNPLLQVAVARAKLIEDIAVQDPGTTSGERHASFVTGLLSLIEKALGLPLAQILDELQYEAPLTDALLRREGRLGILLELAEKIEQGDDAAVADLLTELPALAGEELVRIQIGTFAWLRQSGVC
jgi:EAL and modified HD-GYP domain-containing signal transduction protein